MKTLAKPQQLFTTLKGLQWQLSPAQLAAEALHNQEGYLTDTGALMCDTGKFTGRSPKDKYIVLDETTSHTIAWGDINQAFDPEKFEILYQKMLNFLADKKVYARYVYAGANPNYRLRVCVLNTWAWHNLFCHNLFLRPTEEELAHFVPNFTIINIPEFEADPIIDGTRQGNFTIINLTKRIILIGGTGYAGEMKKGIFTVMNYLLPQVHGVLSMHCAANKGKKDDDTAIFFGLSGTGKTTLSADPDRQLIGDDEHGWTDEGIFNIEGGCYAKVINLNEAKEPQIFGAIRQGAIVENTRFLPDTQTVNYADQSVTENTRTAYPIHFIPNALEPSVGDVPKHIFFLTADAFGVLPPIAKLSVNQAMYHFISGYTAKLAGTEMGVTVPQATFSACFGAAFLPLHPMRYAELLGEKLVESGAKVWLVNTGWTGGGYGVGERIKLSETRAMIQAALQGDLDNESYRHDPIFGLAVPEHCPGVPSEQLNPSQTWADPEAYTQQAKHLAMLFEENYKKY